MNTPLKDTLAKYNVLSREQIEIVVSCATKRNYKKGEYFLKSGEANVELGYLTLGVFRYFVIDEKGNENTSMFIAEGDFFTELESFHEKGTSIGYFQAETDAETLIFDRSNYDRMVSEVQEMEYIFKRLSQKKLAEQLKLFRTILTLEAKDSYLLLLNQFPSIVSRVPDSHLASHLGITRHSLSRIKKKIMEDAN